MARSGVVTIRDVASESGYSYDYVDAHKLSPELRRYYFTHRTLAGYPQAEAKGRIRRWLRLC